MAGKLGAGAGHGQHGRGQAGLAGPAGRRSAWARCSSRPASRPVWSTSSSAKGPGPAEALVASPHVDMVSFTGSTAVGLPHRRGRRAEHEAAAARARRQGRGGRVRRRRPRRPSSANVSSAWAFHSGQICTAPTRLIAQRGIYDELVVGKLAAMAGRPQGRRPAGAGHRARPGDHRRPPRPGRGLRRARRSTRAPPSSPAASGPTSTAGFYVAPDPDGRRHGPT